MAFEQREGSGALFRNKKKQDGDKQPDMRGDALIGGVLYEIAAWTREGANGKWQSLSIKPKQHTQAQSKPPQKPAPKRGSIEDMDSDIPF